MNTASLSYASRGAAADSQAAPQRSAIPITLAGKGLEFLGQALLVVLIPRVLGPSSYGTFALALAIVSIGSLSLSLGGPTVMARFVPAASPGERAATARALAIRLGRWRVLVVPWGS
jgi:O-antigen/teichoic acid export membrane protein